MTLKQRLSQCGTYFTPQQIETILQTTGEWLQEKNQEAKEIGEIDFWVKSAITLKPERALADHREFKQRKHVKWVQIDALLEEIKD